MYNNNSSTLQINMRSELLCKNRADDRAMDRIERKRVLCHLAEDMPEHGSGRLRGSRKHTKDRNEGGNRMDMTGRAPGGMRAMGGPGGHGGSGGHGGPGGPGGPGRHGGMGGPGGMHDPGMGRPRPPMRGRGYGYRPYGRGCGCSGCLFPVLAMIGGIAVIMLCL